MIRGQVNADRQAVITLLLSGPNQISEFANVVVDTGYNGFFTVTPDLAARLNLPFLEVRAYELGDGSAVDFNIHLVTVDWDGQNRDVEALVTDGGILAGMALLNGYTLFIDAIGGGEVRIEQRP